MNIAEKNGIVISVREKQKFGKFQIATHKAFHYAPFGVLLLRFAFKPYAPEAIENWPFSIQSRVI